MTLAAFQDLILAVPDRWRFLVAAAAYRYGDLRARGASHSVARLAVLARRDLDEALILSGLKGEFNSIT